MLELKSLPLSSVLRPLASCGFKNSREPSTLLANRQTRHGGLEEAKEDRTSPAPQPVSSSGLVQQVIFSAHLTLLGDAGCVALYQEVVATCSRAGFASLGRTAAIEPGYLQ